MQDLDIQDVSCQIQGSISPAPHLSPWIPKYSSFVSASLVHVSAYILFISAPSPFHQLRKYHWGAGEMWTPIYAFRAQNIAHSLELY